MESIFIESSGVNKQAITLKTCDCFQDLGQKSLLLTDRYKIELLHI